MVTVNCNKCIKCINWIVNFQEDFWAYSEIFSFQKDSQDSVKGIMWV